LFVVIVVSSVSGRNSVDETLVPPHCFIKRCFCLIVMTNDTEEKGKRKQVEGQLREGVGNLTGNKTEQIKGKIQQIEGKVQEEIGKAKKKS
jgi:uncharacterized protein YjbJ (UPF0337 family)